MRYGTSAGLLILQGDRLLLVHHSEQGKYDFWVPPDRRLAGEESIFQRARRETFEETGLSIDTGRIVYIQEFVEPGYHFCKFFILRAAFTGKINLENRNTDEGFLVEARFYTQDHLNS